MATTSETIYTHTCDLCGAAHEKPELTKLYGPEHGDRFPPAAVKPVIDICPDCHSRPVSDVLKFLATIK